MTDNETEKPTSISLDNFPVPIPVPIVLQHVNSGSSLDDHIDADANIMFAQLGFLMQLWPKLQTLGEMCDLSDQLMKVIHKRRELCLKPTTKAEAGDDREVDITP